LEENLDNKTIADAGLLFNTTGMVRCNSTQGSQDFGYLGNSFCQAQYNDTEACCMRAQLKNIPENPTYGESATLMMFA
jgi:hypothetical protein